MSNVLRHEFIGVKIEITDSKNKSLIGLEGKIVNETKNMFIIETKSTTKKIIKNQIKMKLKFKNKTVEIDGKKLVGAPENRIKNEI